MLPPNTPHELDTNLSTQTAKVIKTMWTQNPDLLAWCRGEQVNIGNDESGQPTMRAISDDNLLNSFMSVLSAPDAELLQLFWDRNERLHNLIKDLDFAQSKQILKLIISSDMGSNTDFITQFANCISSPSIINAVLFDIRRGSNNKPLTPVIANQITLLQTRLDQMQIEYPFIAYKAQSNKQKKPPDAISSSSKRQKTVVTLLDFRSVIVHLPSDLKGYKYFCTDEITALSLRRVPPTIKQELSIIKIKKLRDKYYEVLVSDPSKYQEAYKKYTSRLMVSEAVEIPSLEPIFLTENEKNITDNPAANDISEFHLSESDLKSIAASFANSEFNGQPAEPIILERVTTSPVQHAASPTLFGHRFNEPKAPHISPSGQILSLAILEQFKAALSTRTARAINKLWDQNPSLQSWYLGLPVNFGYNESGQQDMRVIDVDSLIDMFNRVLPYSPYVSQVMWFGNPFLRAWYSGHPVSNSYNQSSEQVLSTIPLKKLTSNFKFVLSSRCAVLISDMWKGNAYLREWFSGKPVRFDIAPNEQPETRIISSKRLVKNFTSVLSCTEHSVIRGMWDGNDRLRDAIRNLDTEQSSQLLKKVLSSDKHGINRFIGEYVSSLEDCNAIRSVLDEILRECKTPIPSNYRANQIAVLTKRLYDIESAPQPILTAAADTGEPVEGVNPADSAEDELNIPAAYLDSIIFTFNEPSESIDVNPIVSNSSATFFGNIGNIPDPVIDLYPVEEQDDIEPSAFNFASPLN